MASTKAKTVAQYLDSLPADRRETISAVRKVILKHLPAGYVETINWGMISYEVPLATYPDTYNGQPLLYAALASQSACSIHLMCLYYKNDRMAELKEAYKKLGRKPNMGKCCIRFKKADDIPLAAIGKIIAGTSLKKYLKIYESVRRK